MINDQFICFEPFADEVKIAEIVAENESGEVWDAMTPGGQQIERESEAIGDSESQMYAAINPDLHC